MKQRHGRKQREQGKSRLNTIMLPTAVNGLESAQHEEMQNTCHGSAYELRNRVPATFAGATSKWEGYKFRVRRGRVLPPPGNVPGVPVGC